nr:PREDICTED: uncharacterized protein LOC103313760 [Tribolium castaneum]|eukprot:XP_015837876.1 PREDICTED: uncharacterized protein LOC103313760 [Tribolium castaneum]
MDFHTLSSSDSINQIRCTSCKNYLSYFPVMLTQEETLCGRCPAKDNSIRNFSFEALAQFLPFPCRYQPQGCCDEFLPGEIPGHEENCKFRVIPCPLDESVACEWQGPRTELLQHCLDEHSDLVLENGEFELDLTCSENFVNILGHENVLLIFKRNFHSERKLLKFVLYRSKHDLGNEHFSCRLEIKGAKNTMLCDFDSSFEENCNMTKIQLEPIVCVTNVAVGKLTIEKSIEKNSQVDEEMLSLLKCIKCSDYAIPPIYYCTEKSNVVCSECKVDHDCVSCQTSEPTRNFSLDGMASLLTYPCKYKRNGCTFTSICGKISKHNDSCEMSDLLCPFKQTNLKCLWKGTQKQVFEHIENNHSEYLFENNSVISLKLKEETTYYRIIQLPKLCFLLNFRKESSILYFTVQAIGFLPHQYKFEIEIQYPSRKGIRLLANKLCKKKMSLRSRYYFVNRDNYCTFHDINAFERNNITKFKITVFK